MFGIIGVEMWKGLFRNRCFPLDQEQFDWHTVHNNLTYDFYRTVEIRERCDPSLYYCAYNETAAATQNAGQYLGAPDWLSMDLTNPYNKW